MLYGIVLKSYSFRITPQLPHSCHTVTPQLTFLCALPQQVPNKHPTSTQQVLELVGILKDGEYSVREIMSFLMLKDRVNFLYKYLTPALEEGLVSMKYPDNPKHPKQKYMLTEKGRKILEK